MAVDPQREKDMKYVELRRCYATLGLSPGASACDIKDAYRKFAKETHPDKNPDDPLAAKKFMEGKDAYEALSDLYKEARGRVCGTSSSRAQAMEIVLSQIAAYHDSLREEALSSVLFMIKNKSPYIFEGNP